MNVDMCVIYFRLCPDVKEIRGIHNTVHVRLMTSSDDFGE